MATAVTTSRGIKREDKYLRVEFANGDDYADYHWFWLRHNCNCEVLCRHEKTKERIIDGAQVLISLRPISVELLEPEKDTIKIVWGQSLLNEPETAQHTSLYSIDFLFQNAYALNRVPVPPPPSDLSLIEIDFTKYSYDQYIIECAKRIRDYGAIVIRNRGLDTEEIIKDFLPDGAEVVPTHFGRIEDLRTDNTTNKNTDQLGYTNAGVDLHTDQCFIENPPGMQALHCITPADVGGDNFVVDAFSAARYLRQENPIAYERLCRTNVRFHRKQKNFEKLVVRPILQVNQETGEVDMVRYSYFTYGPHVVPFEFMEEFYKSYAVFDALIHDPKHQFRFLLNTGDFLLYNNHRMFHARTGFSGPRHVRGVYFNVHDVYKKLNISS